MIEAILSTLVVMGWLGIILGILAIVNIVTGTLTNVWSGKEKFNIQKLLKGIGKVLAFYLCSAAVAIAFTMLPFINEMIGAALISNELVETFSSAVVLGTIIATISVEAKKAINGIVDLSHLSTSDE